MNIYKFSPTTKTIEDLKSSKIYKACEAADQKDYSQLKEMFQYCGFGSDSLIRGEFKLQGWCFDLRSYCRVFLIRESDQNHFRKVYAPDKMSLYQILGGRHKIKEIYEINRKD